MGGGKQSEKEAPKVEIPWRLILSGACGISMALGIAAVVYLEWCTTSDWSEWGECEPAGEIKLHGEKGLRRSTRTVLRGNCAGHQLEKQESCFVQESEQKDYIAEQD